MKLQSKHTTSKKKQPKAGLMPTRQFVTTMKNVNAHVTPVEAKLDNSINQSSAIRLSKELFEKAKCDNVIAKNLTHKSYNGFIINDEYKSLNRKRRTSKSLVDTLRKR